MRKVSCESKEVLFIINCVFSRRRKIRLIEEGNGKYRHLKKLTRKGTLRQVIICLRPRTHTLPPLHTVYVYTVYLFTQGGEGELNQREGDRGDYRSQSGVENTNMTKRTKEIWISPVYKL
jgi:hypothetical protein